MEPNNIKLKLKDKTVEVNSKIADMSDHIKELSALDTTEVRPRWTQVPIPDIAPEVVAKVIEFCEINHYKPPQIPEVNTNELNKILDANNLAFIEKNTSCTPCLTQSTTWSCSTRPSPCA